MLRWVTADFVDEGDDGVLVKTSARICIWGWNISSEVM